MTQEDTATHTSASEQPTAETDALGREAAETAAGGSYSAVATGQSPLDAHTRAVEQSSDRPEILVGAAFAGGFLVAQVLKRLGGGDD
ncbi:MAG TPA: hypothetical protein VF752_10910 [Thermoleophilaceae bacterium]